MNAITEWITHTAGRIGCRVLNRHHYAACRGRADHGPYVDRRGYPVPNRKRAER
jgi:hypothetical protein